MDKYAGNLITLPGRTGFPLYDRGHNQRLVGRIVRQPNVALLPKFGKQINHASVRLAEQLQIRGNADVELLRKAHRRMVDLLAAPWERANVGLLSDSTYAELSIAPIRASATSAP